MILYIKLYSVLMEMFCLGAAMLSLSRLASECPYIVAVKNMVSI